MKTSKYYRLDEKVGGMRGGKSVIKRTTKKIKDYGIIAKKQVKLRMSKLGEKSFLGFKTKSHKARRNADKATGLSSRDRAFIANKLNKTNFKTNSSKARHSRKLRKIYQKLAKKQNSNNSKRSPNKSQTLSINNSQTLSINKVKTQIQTLYEKQKKNYKTNFEKDKNTQNQIKNFLTTKNKYIELKQQYNKKVKAVENARLAKRQAFIDGKSSSEVKKLEEEKQKAKKELREFKLNDLKNARKAFSKAEKKYSKRLTKKGSIEQLNTYSKNQTLGKRAVRTAKDIIKVVLSPITIPLKIGKTIYKTIKNPMKQYRKFKGTRKYFTEQLDRSNINNKKKTEIKNRLRQEFNKNPEKRAEMEKYVYAMDALTSSKKINLPIIDITKSWNSIKEDLKPPALTGLSATEKEIIMDGYKSKFLMEHLKQDEKTMNKKVVNADRILMTSKNKPSLPGTISQNSLERFISEKDALMKKYSLKAINSNQLENQLSLRTNLRPDDKEKIKKTFNDGLKAQILDKKKQRIIDAYNYLSDLKKNNTDLTNKKRNINLYKGILNIEITDPNFESLTGIKVETINNLLDKINKQGYS